jgi:DNA polymerase-3 subunit gamma/tau
MCALMLRQEPYASAPPAAIMHPPAQPNPVSVSPQYQKESIPQPSTAIPTAPASIPNQTIGINHPDSHDSSTGNLPKKPLETVRMKDIKNDFSSNTSIKKPVSKSVNNSLTSDEEQARYEIATPFNQTELVLYWDEYADKLKNDSPHLFSTLKNSRPVLLEDWNIGFSLDNKVLDDELTLRKTEMMEFLRERLNNYKIQLKTSIAETQRNLKPYTDKEKFELMAGKNPALRTLREELDLEIEY